MIGILTSGSASFGIVLIGHEAGQQQEDQGRDRQPRMADGVVDELEHDAAYLAISPGGQRFGRGSAAAYGFDTLAFAHEILPLHDHARAVGNARDPHVDSARPRPRATGTKSTLSSPSTTRTPRSPADEKVSAERGTRVAGTGAIGIATSAVMPSGMAPFGFLHLHLDAIGAGGLARRSWRRSGYGRWPSVR